MKPWKAPISDTKALKITRKCLFDKAFTVRDQEAAGSNPVTPTTFKPQITSAVYFLFSKFLLTNFLYNSIIIMYSMKQKIYTVSEM